MGVPSFAFRSGPEQGGCIVVSLNVSFLCEVKVASVGLRLSNEGGLQIFFGLGSFKRRDKSPVELSCFVGSNASISKLNYQNQLCNKSINLSNPIDLIDVLIGFVD